MIRQQESGRVLAGAEGATGGGAGPCFALEVRGLDAAAGRPGEGPAGVAAGRVVFGVGVEGERPRRHLGVPPTPAATADEQDAAAVSLVVYDLSNGTGVSRVFDFFYYTTRMLCWNQSAN